MIYVNEFEFFEEDGMICALPFGLEGATCGTTLDDAVLMATDWLYEKVKYELIQGGRPRSSGFGHKPLHGGVVIAVSVNCDPSQFDAVSASEAARLLGVSTARIAQMCGKGLLVSWKEGNQRLILRESIQARLAEQPRPGRPRHRAEA